MASIQERTRADGTRIYLAQIVIKRQGRFVFRESRSFEKRRLAEAWAKRRRSEAMAALDAGLDPQQIRKPVVRLKDAIERYTADFHGRIGRTKTQVLRTILDYDIADFPVTELQSHHYVDFARDLARVRSAATVSNYMAHLGSVVGIARPAWGMAIDPSPFKDAQRVCTKLGIMGKSSKRDRRPTLDELNALMERFARAHTARPGSIPMHQICAFAIFSTRRQEEITRLAWEDLDEASSRILVRDMKHPGDKIGNDHWCDLPPPALRIIKASPRNDALIFPYNHRTISANFTRACKALELEDLRFHDLRHEGVSRLFELGLDIPAVAKVSGHRSWQSLQRYTHIHKSGDKYDGWVWLGRLPH